MSAERFTDAELSALSRKLSNPRCRVVGSRVARRLVLELQTARGAMESYQNLTEALGNAAADCAFEHELPVETVAPDTAMDEFEAADDSDRRWE